VLGGKPFFPGHLLGQCTDGCAEKTEGEKSPDGRPGSSQEKGVNGEAAKKYAVMSDSRQPVLNVKATGGKSQVIRANTYFQHPIPSEKNQWEDFRRRKGGFEDSSQAKN